MARRKVYGRRDKRIFSRTANRTKAANVPGHTMPRGGQCL